MELKMITKVDLKEFASYIKENAADGWVPAGPNFEEHNPNFAVSPVYHQPMFKMAAESTIRPIGGPSQPEEKKSVDSGNKPGTSSQDIPTTTDDNADGRLIASGTDPEPIVEEPPAKQDVPDSALVEPDDTKVNVIIDGGPIGDAPVSKDRAENQQPKPDAK